MPAHSFEFSPWGRECLNSVPANSAADNLSALIETGETECFCDTRPIG
jgi:hypothetical protein